MFNNTFARSSKKDPAKSDAAKPATAESATQATPAADAPPAPRRPEGCAPISSPLELDHSWANYEIGSGKKIPHYDDVKCRRLKYT